MSAALEHGSPARRGRPARAWLDADEVARRLAVPGLSGAVLTALLDRVPGLLPGAECHEQRGWLVRSDLLAGFLTGRDSAGVALDGLRALSFKTCAQLLECDAKSLSRHRVWRAAAKSWPGVGKRVPVSAFRELGGLLGK